MALLKAVSTEFGIDASYWNIFSISEDFKNNVLEITLAGYVSKEVRDANHTAVAWNNLTFAGDDYIQNATRTAVYNKLKTGDFSDALDV